MRYNMQTNNLNKIMSNKGLQKGLLGLIIGAAVGSVIGVGLAPDKGENTRKKLKSTLSKLIKSLTKDEK